MYAVVLSYTLRPELRDIRRAHYYVLGRLSDAIQHIVITEGMIAQAGSSDLVFRVETGGSPVVDRAGAPPALRKFSGNSLRAKRRHLLYHGTLLYNFDLSLIETCLSAPPRQAIADYRGRPREYGLTFQFNFR